MKAERQLTRLIFALFFSIFCFVGISATQTEYIAHPILTQFSSVSPGMQFLGTQTRSLPSDNWLGMKETQQFSQLRGAILPHIKKLSIGKLKNSRSFNDESGFWQQTNGPYGGNIFSLAACGANLFAGTNAGGVFLSTNNGVNWNATSLTSTWVRALAISPNGSGDTNIFAGAWGDGVFLSTNKGTNWTQVNTGLTNTAITSLAVFPNGAGGTNLFAGTWGGGVFLSTNNGLSWTSLDASMTNSNIYALTVSSNGAGGTNLFVGTDAGVHVYTNSGIGWTTLDTGLTNANIYALTVSSNGLGDTNLFAGTDNGGVFLSTNNGISWTQANIGLTNASVQAFATSPNGLGGMNLFAGVCFGTIGVYLSTDNGTSWAIDGGVDRGLTNSNVHALLVSPNGGAGINLFAGTDLGAFLSMDNGTSWNEMDGGLIGTYVWSLAISSNGLGQKNIFAGTCGSGAFLSTNGGSTWAAINNRLWSTYVSAIAITSNGAGGTNLFAGTEGGSLYLSTDNGASWNGVCCGLQDLNVHVVFVSDTNIFTGTNGGLVYRSTNNGTNWIEADSDFPHNNAVSFAVSSNGVGGSILFAGTDNSGVYLSTNNGKSWNGVNSGLTNQKINVLTLDSTNGLLYTGTFGGGIYTLQRNTISASSGAYGSITPSGNVIVYSGSNQSFVISPNTGYHVDSVIVDGIKIDSTTSYTFVGVTTNHTIRATFRINTITASAGPNGTINPVGIDTVTYGSSPVYTIAPNTGYHVDSVIVDGIKIDSTTSYTFVHDTTSHTIRVTFRINTYTITASSSPNGKISPVGVDTVTYGSSPVFTITPNTGYHIDSLIVDGIKVDSTTSYTFVGITANHTIRVTFALTPINLALNIVSNWNLVSLPVKCFKDTVSCLFPTCSGVAFSYTGGGYQMATQLTVGAGYWIRSGATACDTMFGFPFRTDTIAVNEGWNLIGSISSPLDVSLITSNPPGIVTSNFFAYSEGYKISDTIYPGGGYWIKVNQAGTLILSAGGSTSLSQNGNVCRIRIVPTSELPPPPPDEKTSTYVGIPKQFALDQNYPNPFNPSTRLQYALPVDSKVQLVIYNLLGQVVAELLNGVETAGYKQVGWNATNVSSGVYFYRLEATSTSDPSKTFTSVKKMILIK